MPDGPWALVVEGLWDALIGRQYGLPTVTGTCGAGTWVDEWSRAFADKRVAIIYDCDAAGRAGAERVRASVAPHSRQVTVLDLARRRSDGWDLSDHLRKHGSTDRLQRLIIAREKGRSARGC